MPFIRRLARRAGISALVALAAAVATNVRAADALEVVRIGGLRADSMIRLFHAERAGYFAKEGLKAEFTVLGSGPAVVSAIVSKSVDVGYSAIVPAVFARANGQPIRMFMTLATESGASDHQGTWIAVADASPVRSVKALAGKTVAINASGALCELLVRDHLAQAGVPYDAVKKVVLPLPQMQAALEVGNADAACMAEPYFANAKLAPKLRARALAAGMLAALDPARPIAQDGMFVREDWGRAHAGVLRKLLRATERATEDFRKDPALYRRGMIAEFKLRPEVADQVAIYFEFGSLAAKAGDVQPLLAAMQRHGLLQGGVDADEFVLPLE